MHKLIAGLLITGALTLSVIGVAHANSCNRHMCPAAQAAYTSGYEVVSQLSVVQIDASELE